MIPLPYWGRSIVHSSYAGCDSQKYNCNGEDYTWTQTQINEQWVHAQMIGGKFYFFDKSHTDAYYDSKFFLYEKVGSIDYS